MTRALGLLLATAALLPGCGGSSPGSPARGPSFSASDSAPATPSPAVSSTPAAAAADPERADPDAVVSEFLAALGGDSDRAWALLSRQSQQSFGSFESFVELESEYGEGLAAFAGLTDRQRLEVAPDLVVVVVIGHVTREGDTEYDAAAIPVRIDGGTARVELPGPRSGHVHIEVPERESPAVQQGTLLRAYVPAAARVTVAIDGERVSADERSADGDRSEVTVPADVAVGPHLLAVAAVRADGLLVAQVQPFDVTE